MVGPDVQFLDVDPQPEGRRPRRTWPALPVVPRPVTTALWVAALTLCLLASAQKTFSYRFAGSTLRSRGGYDAWGRSLGSTLSVDTGPRYAILLWTCAALCAGLAVGSVPGAPQGRVARWMHRRIAAFGFAAVGLLAGTVAGLGLTVQASFANYRALARAMGDGGVDLTVGPSLWFGLGALLCAVGAATAVLRGTTADPGPQPATVPRPQPPGRWRSTPELSPPKSA